jgi:hypothetical protein
MTRRFPPAKILINRGVEIEKLFHPRQSLAQQLNLSAAALTLAGLIVLAWLYPRILVAGYCVLAATAILSWLGSRILEAHLAGNYTRASEKNFPEIEYIKNAVGHILPFLKPIRLYILPHEPHAARWLPLLDLNVLVLDAKIIRAMIDRGQIGQLLWLVGSMMAWQQIRKSNAPWLLQINRWNPLAWPLYAYFCRLTYYSADRIGLALNLSLIDAVEAMKKLAVGDVLLQRLNLDQIEQQAQEGNPSFFAFCATALNSTPPLTKRFVQLVKFCEEHFPDLYADFEQHRHYEQAQLPSYHEIQEFSEAKEEEKKMLRELGKVVFDLMSARPPLNEADSISRAYAQLSRNRTAASELEGKIARLNACKDGWEKTENKIRTSQNKQDAATRKLEEHFKEIGRVAFQALLSEIPNHSSLQKIFAKALQYHVVIRDRQNEIARLEAAAGSVLDKSKRQVEMLSLRTQISNDNKRLQAAAEAAGEDYWKACADEFEHDELEPIKLRIAGVIAELERRRVEIETLLAQKREVESRLENEGLTVTLHPNQQVPRFVQQLTTQARAANAVRPRLQEELGKAYWHNEINYAPETRAIVEQLDNLKKRIHAFEQEE